MVFFAHWSYFPEHDCASLFLRGFSWQKAQGAVSAATGMGKAAPLTDSNPIFFSVQIDLPPTMHISRGLPGLYTAVQMHLHWGGLDLETSGSEHTIDGMRYFAEVRANGAGWREGALQGWQWGNGMLKPTKPAGRNAEASGRNGAPRSAGGWWYARAEPEGAGTEG